MSTATQIAEMFDNDGQQFTDADGQELEAVASDRAAHTVREGQSVRFVFADESVITIAGDGWDIGYPDCFCWQSAGHHCPAA